MTLSHGTAHTKETDARGPLSSSILLLSPFLSRLMFYPVLKVLCVFGTEMLEELQQKRKMQENPLDCPQETL